MLRKISLSIIVLYSLCITPFQAYAAEGNQQQTSSSVKVPNSTLNISKENTYPNATQDMPYLQPSELAKELLDTSNVKIENPDLIRMLNESTISKSVLGLGSRATIFLGHWPLNYESTETTTNWEYQRINANLFDNRAGKMPYQIRYKQEEQRQIKGGLTARVPNVEHVKQMMLLKAMSKTNLPLAFTTVIGAGTKKDQVYNVPPKKVGYLYGYAPAVNEKGKVTYGEVYLVLKGTKRMIIVKNVTSQGIGAWIPVQDYVSFGFAVYDHHR
ncbi:YfkD famly protein [Priestia abyssalis]|uniref:YfkD famly protein n=1 Tax=Priestia abyssalis TaxID=1221450 RepID=UPI00195E41D9|nr:YfkD famly protein [Priestia abyssalis]